MVVRKNSIYYATNHLSQVAPHEIWVTRVTFMPEYHITVYVIQLTL